MYRSFVKSLDEVAGDPDLESKSGGKFYGLCLADKILKKVKSPAVTLRIPRSWVISSDAFDMMTPSQKDFADIVGYWNKMTLPRSLVDDVKRIMALCGGRIALRSSASIEDGHHKDTSCDNKTFSGVFETFLNVKVPEVTSSLKEIYKSLYNPVVMAAVDDMSEIKMSVVVQEMINRPIMSGVIYSSAFEGRDDKKLCDTSCLVIHYVENDTAERMIVAKDKGTLARIPKYVETAGDEGYGLWDFEGLEQDKNCRIFRKMVKDNFPARNSDYHNAFRKLALAQLGAVANHFERELGHPVDMEFAVIADAKGFPVINILQERPYLEKDNFHITNIDNSKITGYPEEKGAEVSGEAIVVEAEGVDADFSYPVIPDLKDKIIIMKKSSFDEMNKKFPGLTQEQYEYYQARNLMLHEELVRHEHYKNSAAIVDTTGYLYSALYGHYGNELRRNEVPFIISRKDMLGNVENGDKICLDISAGELSPPHNSFSQFASGFLKKLQLSRR